MEKIKLNFKQAIAICAASFFAGGINGFLGTGGGIVLIYALEAFTDIDKKDNLATTLCAIIPISIVSAVAYGKSGNIDTSLIRSIAIVGVTGGCLGAFLTDKIKVEYLNLAFSALVIYSGISMVVR